MPDAGLSHDRFLDGRITAAQPRTGFRSGADAVLLAAAVPAHTGDVVLELGLGAGVASLCLGARVPGLTLTGLEVQRDYGELARRNAAENDCAIEVLLGDVADPPADLKGRAFDQVLMNPPYYRSCGATPAQSDDRARGLSESVPLSVWMDLAARRLKPGGTLTMIQKAPRLADVLAAADNRLGSLAIKPVAARVGRAAELVILRFKKGGRADPVLHAPLILHAGENHQMDAPDPTPLATAVLRRGEALQF